MPAHEIEGGNSDESNPDKKSTDSDDALMNESNEEADQEMLAKKF